MRLARLLMIAMMLVPMAQAFCLAVYSVEHNMPVVSKLPTEVRGDSVVWVMTGLESQGTHTRLVNETSADSVTVNELNSRRFFVIKGDTVAETRFENRAIAFDYSSPISLFNRHVNYGDSAGGEYTATGRYYGVSYVGARGDYYTVVDGRGTIMIDDLKLENVERVHHNRKGVQLIAADVAAVDSYITSSPNVTDSLMGSGTLSRFEHDFWWWFVPGVTYPVAEAVSYVSIDIAGRRCPVMSYCLLNLPGESDCLDEITRPGDEGNVQSPTFTSGDLTAALSADGMTVTVDFSVNESYCSRRYIFGVFDPAGRQLGRLEKIIDTARINRVIIPLNSLSSGQLLLSIMDENGRSLTYKVNRE